MVEQVSSLKTGIKYKDTPIGKIPVDWSFKTIGELCEILDYKRVPLNKEQRDKMKGYIPYYGANGVIDYINDYIFDDELVLMAEDGGYFGEYKNRPIAYMIHGKSWVNNHAHVLKVKESDSTSWVYYSVVHKNIVPFIKGGTRSKLNQEDLKNITIPLPPQSEQKKIAEILTIVDEAIEKTARIIETTKEVKKGLMQRLLTRGIGHQKFKKTEIGEIPEEWKIKKIADLAKEHKGAIKIGPFGSQIKKSEMVDGGIRVYGQENVYRKNFDIGKYYITPEKFQELKTVEIFPGDIVITMMGTIGDCCVFPEGIQKGIMDSHLMRIQLKNNINPFYVTRLIRESPLVKKQINDMSQGGIMSGLNLTIVKEIKIPVPPLEEQNEIEKILSEVDNEAGKEQENKSGLEQLKKGLMQVLLTGKVRVSV